LPERLPRDEPRAVRRPGRTIRRAEAVRSGLAPEGAGGVRTRQQTAALCAQTGFGHFCVMAVVRSHSLVQ